MDIRTFAIQRQCSRSVPHLTLYCKITYVHSCGNARIWKRHSGKWTYVLLQYNVSGAPAGFLFGAKGVNNFSLYNVTTMYAHLQLFLYFSSRFDSVRSRTSRFAMSHSRCFDWCVERQAMPHIDDAEAVVKTRLSAVFT